MAKDKIDFTKQPDLGSTATSDMSTPEKVKYQVQSADKDKKKKAESKPEKKITTELNSTPEEHEKAKKDTMVREGYGAKPAEEKPLKTDLNTQLDEKAAEIGISLTPEIKNSDEVQYIVDAVENGNPSKISDVTTPNNVGLFNLEYDQNGNAFAAQIPEISKPALESKGAAALFTVTSILLSIATGGLFPPINFGELLGTNEYWEKVDAANKAIADIANKGYEQNLMNEVQNKQTQERINLAEANKGKLNAYSQLQEAEAGGTSYQQAVLSAELQKSLQENQLNMDLTKMKLTFEQQKDMANLLYDQEVKRVVNEIQVMKDKGMSNDEIAKYMSSKSGNTSVKRFFDYFGQGTQGAANLISVFNPSSDKKVKTFDAKPVNTNMLRKAWGKR